MTCSVLRWAVSRAHSSSSTPSGNTSSGGIISASSLAASAAAGPCSQLVVFGDSLSDVGNIADATADFPFVSPTPGPYYYEGRFSNGPVYAETLASGLDSPPPLYSRDGGNNFARAQQYLDCRIEARCDRVQEGRQIGRADEQVEPAGLDARQVQDVVDQREQVLAALPDRRQPRGAALGEAPVVLQDLRVAEDRVQRRAQLVAHVGEELRLGGVGRLRAVARAQVLVVAQLEAQHQLLALIVGGDQLALALLQLAVGPGEAGQQQAHAGQRGEHLAGDIDHVEHVLRDPDLVQQRVQRAADEDHADENVEPAAFADEEGGDRHVGEAVADAAVGRRGAAGDRSVCRAGATRAADIL